jgi:hypothetical protein
MLSFQCSAQNQDNEYNRNPILIGGYDSLINATKNRRLMNDCVSIRDKVFVQFSVSAEGKLSDIEVIKGLCPEQDSVAVEIVKSLLFKPGLEKGKPIEFKRVIGIPFTKSE